MSKRETHREAEGGALFNQERVLTHAQAQAFYNWMGRKQDWQAFYEAKAAREFIAHASFETAQAVFEFGCGTGALAERLLRSSLVSEARYLAVDSSSTMIHLAQARLARFGSRVQVSQTDGSFQFAAASRAYDRFISTYVMDLLSLEDIAAMLVEAHRLLRPEGLLCLVSLTPGPTWFSRRMTALWSGIHRLAPSLVGGCRPLGLQAVLPLDQWQLVFVNVVTAFGIPSEIVVAKPAVGGVDQVRGENAEEKEESL